MESRRVLGEGVSGNDGHLGVLCPEGRPLPLTFPRVSYTGPANLSTRAPTVVGLEGCRVCRRYYCWCYYRRVGDRGTFDESGPLRLLGLHRGAHRLILKSLLPHLGQRFAEGDEVRSSWWSRVSESVVVGNTSSLAARRDNHRPFPRPLHPLRRDQIL